MAVFTYSLSELRDIHDWNNSLRPIIDTIELIVLVPFTFFGFMYAISGNGMWSDEDGLHSPPVWELFTSWRAFSHLIIGGVMFLAGVLLIRDWMYGLEERREEQMRRKVFEEELRQEKERVSS
jgi:hypothetical protein